MRKTKNRNEIEYDSGIELIGKAPWGTHLCQFYQSTDDLIDILVPYFKAGLENNEFCMWITSEPLSKKDAKAALKMAVKNVDKYMRSGQLEILDHSEWYTKAGKFDADEILKGWMKKEKAAIKNGFSGLRLTGNTFWLEKTEWKKFVEYEEAVNNVIGKHKMLAICSYSLDKCDASEIIDVVANHQFALIRRKGNWEIIQNSEQKHTEEGLRESEERYRSFIENFQGIAYRGDKNFKTEFFHGNVQEITGYTEEDFIEGKIKWTEIIHKDDLSKVLEDVENVISNKLDSCEREYRILSKDKNIKWVQERFQTLLDDVGNIAGAQGTFHDITERKRAEEKLKKHHEHLEELIEERTSALRKSEKQASAAIEAARAFTFSYDIASDKIEWGGAIEEITGYTKKEFAKVDINGWAEKIHPDDRDEVMSILKEAMGKDRAATEYRFKTKKGYVTLSSISLTEKENGKPVRLVGILQDITERKQMQEQLARQEKLAVLGQLAGGVGHELRNPLGAIKNAAYFLNMAIENPEQEVKESLEIIDEEVSTSDRIISSLLDFARAKPPTLRKVDINDIVRKSVSRITMPENVKVVNQLGKVSSTALADSEQLDQIFGNIILNAVQAMDKGGHLTIKSKLESQEQLAISFTDTGEGISKENLEKLFEPLFTSKAKGIGLGLVVVKSLLEGHNGTIDVQTHEGKGSTFTIKLPIIRKDGE